MHTFLRPFLRPFLLLALSTPLAACGSKGDLYRSDEPSASVDHAAETRLAGPDCAAVAARCLRGRPPAVARARA